MIARLLALALLLLPAGALAQSPPETFAIPLDELSELTLPLTARVSASGRVGAGLVVNGGTHVITLLHTVRVGYPAAVQTGSGHVSLARIVTWDRMHEIALLVLDEPVPETPAPVFANHPRVGEQLFAFGHGGSVGLSVYDGDLRALTAFTPLPLRVLSQRLPTEEEREARVFPDFLVDRPPGDGDRGAPVVNEAGEVVGLLRSVVDDGGGRAVVIPSPALTDLLEAPQDRKYPRPTHLQTWSGMGIAAHNRPSTIGAFGRLGFRVAILDALRLEPWAEVLIGTRAPFAITDEEGETIGNRERDLWWSIDAGMDFGYRIPIPVEGSRDYIVPNVGFRVGWNRFQHGEESLVASCEDGGGGCRWMTEKVTDQIREFRGGIDVGIDVQHGRVRFGYRFFIDPTAVAEHSMHRLLITFDGFPLDIAVGDSR
ncbi:MAG: trypsin-like peptidase domain-containing protein [Deltaproteobacteria bacterium]|nr:trypsin-like peptidase domain-containing protein [Deltaproteobacteria bacterium]